MLYDLNILEDYVARGLVEKNVHPTLPIAIYNYSRECQFTEAWDEITLNMRGTVIDNEGKVVAMAFPKFFNYEEVIDEVPVSGDYVYIQEKVDGSLGILFNYADEWHLATKGSFSSDQAKKGMEILKSKYDLRSFMKEFTYLCEIIYPENRIVVDYAGEEKIVFLSATSNGEELHWTTAQSIFKASGIKDEDVVKTEQHFAFGTDLYKSLKEKNEGNKEGFVLRFQPGNFRMKIKFEEYVRLHRLLTNFSNVDIWEYLKDKKDINHLLERVPDEFDRWVRQTISSLQYGYHNITEYSSKAHYYFRYGKYSDVDPEPTKKEYAEHVKKNIDKKYWGLMFATWDGNQDKIDEIVWKMLRPQYQKPFWQKTTELRNSKFWPKQNEETK